MVNCNVNVSGDNEVTNQAASTAAGPLRLKKPCQNCPFRTEGSIGLRPGRLEGIAEGLLEDDLSSFHCHKTIHSKSGGEWNDDGEYIPSGKEAVCAGSIAYLLNEGRPSVPMRLAVAIGILNYADYADAREMVFNAKCNLKE